MNATDGFGLKGQAKWIKTKGGILVAESAWSPNVVLTGANRGISILLDRLAGITTHAGIITFGDMGDDSTAATAADTGLGNALVRAQISAVSRSGLTTDFRFFYPDVLTPNDTYREFGMVIGGTSTLETGQPFNHLVMSPLVKAAGEDHTVVCRITGSV